MAKMTRIMQQWLGAPSARPQVQLPQQSGQPLAVNPAFVMAVEALTASTTEITVAGKGQIVILLSFADTLTALGPD